MQLRSIGHAIEAMGFSHDRYLAIASEELSSLEIILSQAASDFSSECSRVC
jgi:hypothetical protein